VVVEVEKGSFLTGTYRLKVKDFWSATIFVNATVSEIKASIEAISGVFVRVSNLERSTLGGIKFEITFLHYVGDEPFGFIPWTAGDLSPLVVDKENLKGCSFIITNIVKKIGTSPIDTSEDLKGFRLVPPGISTTYPLAKVTRWLCHNESNSNMKEALLQTGGLDFDIDVSRDGPFSNGSYKWHVTYPLGESSMGSSWGVVRDGGAAIQLLGHGANVSTFVTEAGTAKATGHFRLNFPIDAKFNDEAETTGDIPVNASASLLKSKLETLPSIASVEVATVSLDKNMTDSGAKKWEITFTSMRNIGDISMLIADASKVKGTGVSMKIKEIVKGSGNTLYLLRIPVHAYMQGILSK
jgi:hypothetical protein